ncbi:MAG: hypothetical protein NTV51_26595 [Verrucomicrobia bacterium]|nr:hypothetical protein [Verrucomicrobiota bacterium]
MKTLHALPALAAFLASLGFAAIALAGPGPQYWNRPAPSAPAAKPAPASCGGCATTTPSLSGDRGPNGRGAHDAAIAQSMHSCSLCSGAVTTTHSQTKDTMVRAAACGTLACCR